MNSIELRDIEMGFDGRLLFRCGHIDIESRGVYPLLGLNGSGKSTLMRMLAGVIRPQSGRFSLNGRLLYQPQSPALFSMTVLKNAVAGMAARDEERALAMLSDVGLAGFERAKARSLSGGEKARLCLCRSMLTGGDIFLLDEPFAAIDSRSADPIALYLKDYCAKTRATLLVTVHSPHTARLMSERCLLIRDGELSFCEADAARDYFIGAI